VVASLSRQRDLLDRAPAFRLLFLSTLGSGIGTWLATIALTIDVYDRTRSGSWVSALLIVDFLPTIFIGLLLGSLLDRLPRQRLMVVADLARMAVFCYLPFSHSALAIVAAGAVVGTANGFFRPAVYAGMPNLVSDEELPHANALFQTAENATWALGPLLGGGLVAANGPHLAYWINAATFLVSALLVARISRRSLQAAQALTKGHLIDLKEGIAVVLRSRTLLTVLVAWTIVMLGSASMSVTGVILAKQTFSAGAFGFGLLTTGSGVGLVVGSLLAGQTIERRGVATAYAGAIALDALGITAAAVSPDIWVAASCVVLSGLGNGVASVCNGLLVQRGAPDELRGRAITLIMSVNYVVLGLAMAAAGVIVDHVGPRWLWGGAGAATLAGAVAAAVLAPRRDAPALPSQQGEAAL
jgi:MFS family permease